MTTDANSQDPPTPAYAMTPDANQHTGSDNLRHLAEALPEIVWTSNPDGVLDFISSQWGHFSGLDESDPDYLNWALRIHPDHIDEVHKKWGHSLKTGEIYEHEFQVKSACGDYFWFWGRAIPVLDENREILKWYGVTVNVDQQKKMEFRLREIAVQKDTFLAMLGHELRNPLAAITTGYELLSNEKTNEQQRATAFELLGQQIRHLTRLVDDTLDVSRISSGKLRLSRVPVELNKMIQDSIELNRADTLSKDITLECRLHPEPIWVNGDEVRLTQCLTNLLDNAIKFTAPGGSIHVSTSLRATIARIEVTDSGVGMTSEEICRIFEPFEQGLGAQQLSTAGLGLGLAVVEKLINLHGGKITARSRGKGHGTTFSLTIKSVPTPTIKLHAKEVNDEQINAYKILILEDNESVAQTLKMFFELEGHHVMVAHDGESTLKICAYEKPDLLLSDLNLPGSLSGWDVATQLCKTTPAPERPYLVALSGHTQPHDRERSKEAGFDDHLAKPPTPDQLRKVVGNIQKRATVS
ncbi:MAG: ATP-binding protein [Akkermansiaceae bacterium]